MRGILKSDYSHFPPLKQTVRQAQCELSCSQSVGGFSGSVGNPTDVTPDALLGETPSRALAPLSCNRLLERNFPVDYG